MAKPQKSRRKYPAEVMVIQNLELESLSTENEKPRSRKSSRKGHQENRFSRDVIFGLIEKIKDM